MPYGFSGGQGLVSQTQQFGRDSAQMILQTGQMITQGLQTMMTNRQVQALGAELGSLNPQSPEWAQQAIQLGSRYPLAMKSEAGQFMLGTQAKAHAEWTAAQRAQQQAQATLGRQVQLENLRTRNDMDLERLRQQGWSSGTVDLSGVNLGDPTSDEVPLGLPAIGAGMPGLAAAVNSAPSAAEQVPLFGMRGSLSDIARSALGPLQEAQAITGVAPTRAQAGSAIAAERTRRNQQAMQEDRQRQQEAMAARRSEEDAAKAAAKAAEDEVKGERKDTLKNLGDHRRTAVTNLNRAAKAFEDSFDPALEDDNDEQYFKLRKRLQSEVTLAQRELEGIDTELKSLLQKGEKTLSREEAAAILKEAGGDKAKARQIARERGFTL